MKGKGPSTPSQTAWGLIGLLAAVENVFPPVPADTAVVLGAFLAHRGVTHPWVVLLVTMLFNMTGAMAMYFLADCFSSRFHSACRTAELSSSATARMGMDSANGNACLRTVESHPPLQGAGIDRKRGDGGAQTRMNLLALVPQMGQSSVGLPNSMPACDISSASVTTLAACSIALDGMQPTLRQTPPRVG